MPVWSLLPTDKDTPTRHFDVSEIALLSEDGDLDPAIVLVTGGEAVAQRIFARLRFFLGEWFLDQRLGFPWFRDVFIMSPDLVIIKSEIQRCIAETPGVEEVRSVNASFNKQTRSLEVMFEAVLFEGSILSVDSLPFIFPAAA